MSRPLVKRKSTMKLASLKSLPDLKIPLKDSVYEEFISILSVQKVKTFSEKCKEKEMEIKSDSKKDLHLKRGQIIPILKQTFPSQTESFTILYEQIFNRFKALKCEIRCQSHKMDNYYIDRIIPEEEVDIYEISCALACFIKCDVKEKLNLIFDLTDGDDDGFVCQNEIKKMVYTLNYLFSDEETPIQMNSSVLHQSLASIRSQQAYKMIMKYPGELNKLFLEERYVSFEDFFRAVEKIPNYKFILVPLFVGFKKCIMTFKNEKEFDMRQKNYSDFSKISNEVISLIKANNDIGKTFTDFKKGLEPIKQEEEGYKTFFKMKTKIASSIYNPNNNNINSSKKTTRRQGTLSRKKTRRNDFIFTNIPHHDDKYEINYNKINGLETYPGKINLIESNKTEYNTTAASTLYRETGSFGLRKMGTLTFKQKNVGPFYMTFNEIIAEIKMLVNKHKTEEVGNDELIKLSNKIRELAHSSRNRLKDPNPFSNLLFGKVEYNKTNKYV